MKRLAIVVGPLAILCTAALATVAGGAGETSLQAQNNQLFKELSERLGLTDEQVAKIRSIFASSSRLGQGNPAVTVHPMTTAQCRAKLERESVTHDNPRFEKICGAKYMAPLYDPASQKPEDAKACVDKFEFPNMPCSYPVVWVRAREAAQICEAQGKRMCDAHEWEGACAGSLSAPDYPFELARGGGVSASVAIGRMRAAHNSKHASDKTWSYGSDYRAGVCGAASAKTAGCGGGEWSACGSNTYPAGSFTACHSKLGVYDLNGNAAEHMNLPTNPGEMASLGSKTLGHTEMKGSWFVFDKYRAHEDWCRWRAPYWHGSRVMDTGSHSNYHLSFRCCKDTSRSPD